MPDQSWRQLAECQYVGTEIFFKDEGGHGRYSEARLICNLCEVRLECLNAALREEAGLENSHRFGLRGGLGPRQRLRLSIALGIKAETEAVEEAA